MKRFTFACVLCGALLMVAGCDNKTDQPAAQSPPAESAEQHEVMKPAMPEVTPPALESEAETPAKPAEPVKPAEPPAEPTKQ
ncbi:hypothetical protein Pla52o_29120 [Novipirellula galeiformis]|uniref:Lipoprotein n=1 Tax=Novipirellula galeiformis TaxID=2528004 RepID=A0A5C6CJV1_9BACT|nr:hypothetical protein [Novipirellula galeiformis]TWU23376.1 hypothetical protein Pla52o_29120 [Novipirellula galeiformis]